MMTKIALLLCLTLILYSKEVLYLNYPHSFPSKRSNTSFGKELIKLIDSSKDEIVFAIYGLRDQKDILKALLKAKKRGVIVKGVVDSDLHNHNYYKDTKILYRYFDIKSDHLGYIMHNKFFVIDKKILWSGSSNISDTSTGGYNANNVIVIENKTVAKAYIDEFNQMFYKGRFHKKKYSHTIKNIKTETSTISLFFSPKSNTYENGIKRLIKEAKKYIYIPIFYLTHKKFSKELILAHKRGVDIKIILDATAARNRYSMHKRLRDAGLLVKVENFGGKMHAKSIIIDDRVFVTGSMNLTKAGNWKNDENTLIIRNRKLSLQYREYFLKLWNTIPKRYLSKDPNPESFESINSCFDGIDNDFDKKIDREDSLCKKAYKKKKRSTGYI